ncbi:MAG: hypothetical protein WCS70_09790 [Verrucomicrobiota bacterium]
MTSWRITRWGLVGVACWYAAAPVVCRADDTNDLREIVRQLQHQVAEQQRVINSLTEKIQHLDAVPPSEPTHGISIGKRVVLSGEAGIAFFSGDKDSQYPHAEFRIDEAKVFLDALVMDNVYFFAELNLTQRESGDNSVDIGELYLDVENISRFWHHDNQLSLRAGRMDIPFGEEYLMRDAIDNPLIFHTLADFWGVDEGVEFYGKLGKVSYVFAVQNGGEPPLRDANADKSFTGRLSIDPTQWLHLSASGMRTGTIDVNGDGVAEMWFGNAYLGAIGPAATTFHAEIAEGDVMINLPRGRIWASGGYLHFDDNDPNQNDNRDIYFYSVEGLVNATDKFYVASRFSQILVSGGYTLVGNGNYKDYLSVLTSNLWRLSLGGGYRFNQNLVVKLDYTFEQGTEIGGDKRTHEDVFAVELAAKF